MEDLQNFHMIGYQTSTILTTAWPLFPCWKRKGLNHFASNWGSSLPHFRNLRSYTEIQLNRVFWNDESCNLVQHTADLFSLCLLDGQITQHYLGLFLFVLVRCF
uniref:Uncharacterized protein n=1 Tax=Arundo donax TaxID=35708 RepID=A0A0A9FSC2_ARUDO